MFFETLVTIDGPLRVHYVNIIIRYKKTVEYVTLWHFRILSKCRIGRRNKTGPIRATLLVTLTITRAFLGISYSLLNDPQTLPVS